MKSETLFKFSFTLALSFAVIVAKAKVILPAVISDNMVLQQRTNAAIWGKAKADVTVNVITGWNKKKYSVVTDKTGNWKVKVPTPAYGGPYTIQISDGELTELKNVLIGDVWICSGQSNMEMPLAGWGRINNFEQEIAQADYKQIRLLQVNQATSNGPLEDAKVTVGAWAECSPATVPGFSSTAYFFAREVYKRTKIPIGLIHTSWGGTVAEAWMSGAALKKIPEFKAAALANEITDEQDKTYPDQLAKWAKQVTEMDTGYNVGKSIWTAPTFDVSTWSEMTLPGYFENTLKNFDGVVWYVKKVTVPKTWTGKELKINLGPIDDDEVTWFNGVEIGRTQGYDQVRTYKIPGHLVTAGENTIVVKVFDSSGGGGLYGEANAITLVNQHEQLPLNGAWKYHIGLNLKDAPPIPVNPNNPNRPGVLFNAMINPFLDFSIKGAIWYQGESNADRACQYRTLFPALINDWREKWQSGNFPFYFVQLANYMKREEQPEESDWAALREAQLKTLTLPNTGMAVTIDIGDAKDIHPKNKQEVGRRLALIALAKTYHQQVEFSGPVFESQKIEGDKIKLIFKPGASPLKYRDGSSLKGFSIADQDKKFHWAAAVIKGNEIIISSVSVKNPVAVRYAWGNNPEANLTNSSGIPVSPFRTDDWDTCLKP